MVSSESCCVIYCISDLVSFWCLNFLDPISKAIFCSLFLYRLCCCLLRASKSLLCSRCTVRIFWIPVSLSPATQTAAMTDQHDAVTKLIVNFHWMEEAWIEWLQISIQQSIWYHSSNQVQSEWNSACSQQSVGLAQPSQVSDFINVG